MQAIQIQYKVLLDIDGVVGNFNLAAAKALGVDLNDITVRKVIKDGQGNGWDRLFDSNKMWRTIDSIGESFWSEMELLPWANRLYEFLKEFSNDNLYFCTAPSSDPSCAAGKVAWIKKHFKTRKFAITPKKYLLAKSTNFLVDDNFGKVKSFRENGGPAFLWPESICLIDGDLSLEETFKNLSEALTQWISKKYQSSLTT